MKEAIYLRDKYACANDIDNWKYWRNKATEMVRKGKTEYYKELIEANMHDSKKLWSLIHEIAPKEQSASPVNLQVNSSIISDPKEICQSFNEYFANIASSVLENMQNSQPRNHTALKEFINSKVDENVSFSIPSVSVDYVLKELMART